MYHATVRKHLLFCAVLLAGLMGVQAQYLDQIGVTLLRAMTTNLNGTGIRVAQSEASISSSVTAFEVNPADLPAPASLFRYFSANSSSTTYPNILGTNSWHAEFVGSNFYSAVAGVATNVAHVDNYYAPDSYGNIFTSSPTNFNDAIVNQSWVFYSLLASQAPELDSYYDNYAEKFGTLFVTAAGDGGPITNPATCYNGIAVGVSDGPANGSSYGPTLDNGRSKPDIIAPGYTTSYSAPFVAGSAAVLMQAALRGDGGAPTNAAADIRTLKALLLNGTVKPIGWTNSSFAPLHTLYGAGLLNVFNSYEQLVGGRSIYMVSKSVTKGAAHPPTGATGTISFLSGWDFNTNSSSMSSDTVNHYYFNVSNVVAATATLVWNRQQNVSTINHLALFLYNAANSNLILQSTSVVDNVQHIFTPRLPTGRYDLQVWKAGGSGIVSAAETYALAWAFAGPNLSLVKSGASAVFSWPVYPAGYAVEATPTLAAPAWSTNSVPGPDFTTGTNVIQLPMTNGAQFFRLQQPGS